MATTIYILLSQFHPGLFQQNPLTDDYSPDQCATFFVVHAFCQKSNLSEYFKNSVSSPELNYVFYSGNESEDLQKEWVPVPLPPHTILNLTISTESGQQAYSHSTTDKNFFFLDKIYWPKFAILSQSLPLKSAFDQLTIDQKELVYQALLLMAGQMRREGWNTFAPIENANDPRSHLWEMINNKPDISISNISELENIQNLYSAFYNFSPNEGVQENTKVSASLPQFEWAPQELIDSPPDELFKERSYLEYLWDALRKLSQLDKEQLIDTLIRLFFFGERLAWPVANKTDDIPFMILRPTLDRVSLQGLPEAIKSEDWFITNAVSLMGLVFRIPLTNSSILPKIKGVSLNINYQMFKLSEKMIHALKEYSSLLEDDIKKPRPTIAISIHQKTTLFTPRQAPLLKLPLDDNQSHFVVGEALLDVADSTARFSTASPGSLPGKATRPIGLKMNDVAGLYVTYLSNPQSVKWIEQQNIKDHFDCFQRIHADLSLLPWSDTLLSGEIVNNSSKFYDLRPNENFNSEVAEEMLSKKPLKLYYLSANGTEATYKSLVLPDTDFTSATSQESSLGVITAIDADKTALDDVLKSSDQRVTLIYEMTLVDGHFDLLKPKNSTSIETVVLVLNHAGISRLGLTTDRLVLSLYANWTPQFDPTSPESPESPLTSQASETDKLRLHLKYEAEETYSLSLALSNPAALLPLPHPPSNDAREIQPSLAPWKQSLKPLSPNGPQAAYWLAHHFDQPANTINNGQPSIDEKIRFLLWNNAGKKDIFKLSGYFEHQYGHRISLQSEVPLDFKRSVDIVNPASIFFGEQAKIANNNKNSLYPLLQVKENPDDTLDIYFSTLAIRYAYQYYFTHPSNESTGTESFFRFTHSLSSLNGTARCNYQQISISCH